MLDNKEIPSPIPVAPPEKKAETVASRESEPGPETATATETVKKEEPVMEPAASVLPSVPWRPVEPVKDTYHVKIERILEDNLVDVYISLPPAVRARFKAEGEATALRLRAMVEKGKVRAKSVLGLIVGWLKMIPGVNRFFLEQEAKMKTDRVLLLVKEKQEERQGTEQVI